MPPRSLLLALAFFVATAVSAQEPLRLSGMFSDHAVLQREQPIPVWGWAAPGAEVTVTLGDDAQVTRARADGTWRLNLPARPAGGPFTLRAEAGAEAMAFENVLVGDVWLASGQSNMEWPLRQANDAEAEIAAADDAQMRFFVVEHTPAPAPSTEVPGGPWQIITPETAPDVSAVAYFFAREIRRTQGVPVGIVQSAWGGTLAEAWTSAEGLEGFPTFTDKIEALRATPDIEALMAQEAERSARRWFILNEDSTGRAAGVHRPDYDDRAWPTADLPTMWHETPIGRYDGVAWLRKTVELPADWAGQDLELHLGRINHRDDTYVNGRHVGTTSNGPSSRVYTVPRGAAESEQATIAVRAMDTYWSDGGFWSEPEALFVTPAGGGDTLSLAGPWRYNADLLPPVPTEVQEFQHEPAFLFNGMIAPAVPYGIRGVIWYQGESNAGRPHQYRSLFKALINDWRVQWGQGHLPFLFVQLANFMEDEEEPTSTDWAELREAQAMALELPKTGMAVAIDVGEADDIHPRNKQDVGRRLAQAARAVSYGEEVVPSGPVYHSHEVRDGEVVLRFDHAGDGLELGDDAARAFAIAGADGSFRWANARLEGDAVVVWHPDVATPTAVRYAWGNNPDAPLYNAEGLPAVPFRTDLSD